MFLISLPLESCDFLEYISVSVAFLGLSVCFSNGASEPRLQFWIFFEVGEGSSINLRSNAVTRTEAEAPIDGLGVKQRP